jgi:hypothetical protein
MLAMKTSASVSLSLSARRANLPLAAAIVVALSVVLGMLLTDTADEMIAYLLVTFACVTPIALWVWNGALGVPLLPAISGMYFIYFGLPLIRNKQSLIGFGSWEILVAAATVALFLVAATLVWWLVVGQVRRSNDATPSLISGPWLVRIILLGLVSGLSFHVGVYSNAFVWLGPFFGVLRSAMLSFAISACFMLGHARAMGWLRGQMWALAVTCAGLMILVAWLSFFLVGGMLYCLAAILGYVITSKRVPWRFLAAALAVIIVFHAGKDQMREKYWQKDTNFSTTISVLDAPSIMEEWIEAGLTSIFADKVYSSAIDRASLLALLLEVERLVPDYIPYIDGASYAVLPEMLVPRFLVPDKIASQAGMTILNVSAGFQTEEGASKTAIGWGLLPEAYFNFGYVGVIGIGLLFGLFCGFLQRWTIGASLFSLPCLVAVSALMQLISMELDAAGAVTAIFQAVASVSIVYWFIRLLVKKKSRSAAIAGMAY